MLPEKPIRIIAIFGPTAVGKSAVAARVAQVLDGEIVSADSMQVYRGIPIITDQPSPELLAAVPHHLVGTVGLDEEYSAARFVEEAGAAISDICERGRLPVLVGGTGLYIRALLGGFSFAGTDEGSRQKWEELVREQGTGAALDELRRLDPEAEASVDADNPRRIIRALEAAESGEPVSAERDRLWSVASPYRVTSFALEMPRQELYERIDRRVGRMLAGGALAEVEAALSGRISRTASQAIGLNEIRDYLSGEASLEETVAAIRQKSRNYAKRQLTWMRKMPDIVRIDVAADTAEKTAESIIERIQSAK